MTTRDAEGGRLEEIREIVFKSPLSLGNGDAVYLLRRLELAEAVIKAARKHTDLSRSPHNRGDEFFKLSDALARLDALEKDAGEKVEGA